MKSFLKRFKILFRRLMPLGVLSVLLLALIVPASAYSGSYGSLSGNMLNYDAFFSAEWKLTDERMEVISDTIYRMNLRTDLAFGQTELYPYYSTGGWFAKSTSYIPFKTAFPYVRVGDTLNLAYYTNNNYNGGISFRVMDGTTSEDGYASEWWCSVGAPLTVTENMITQGYVTFRAWHTQGQSNNVYLRALGVYVGSSTVTSETPLNAYLAYAQAVYTTWLDTKALYDELAQQAYNEAYNAGYGNGKADGYVEGYNKGVADTQDSNNTFGAFFNSAFQAPLNFLQGLFGWELFGVNLWALLKALFTIIIAFTLITIILRAVF